MTDLISMNIPDETVADALRKYTSARIFAQRVGTALSTRDQLSLRFDHAVAADAVRDEVYLEDLTAGHAIGGTSIFSLDTEARDKKEYLTNPEAGRRLAPASRAGLKANGDSGCDVQIFIGDGLSAAAVRTQAPDLLLTLTDVCRERGLSVGRPFFVRHCRVGVLNDIGDILEPKVAVLLIGERPGLTTADSLSAYLAFAPRHGHTDAHRNLISNIHGKGVTVKDATSRIMGLVTQMLTRQMSGVQIKELNAQLR